MITKVKVTATVTEISPATGYSVVRFQLASVDGTTTSGDAFSIVMEDTEGYEVGQVYQLEFGPNQG
jgi:hypothetical protein